MDDLGLQTPTAPPTPPPPPPVMPETPNVTPPKKKFPFKPVAGALMALLLVGGVIALSRQLALTRQTAEQRAAIPGACQENTTKPECDQACGPEKNGKKYECKWDLQEDKCKESGKECAGGNQTECKNPLAQIVPCTNTLKTECSQTATCEGFCIDSRGKCGCNQVRQAKGCQVSTGCSVSGTATCYLCPEMTSIQPCGGTGAGHQTNPPNVHFNSDTCSITGNFCGVVQCDGATSGSVTAIQLCSPEPSPRVSPTPSPRVSPTPSPSPEATLACVDLTKNKPAPQLEDTVTFVCKANMTNITNPQAYWHYSTDGGVTFSNALPAGGKPVDPTTMRAAYNITINKPGDWEVQCRICGTAGAGSRCTVWGRADSFGEMPGPL